MRLNILNGAGAESRRYKTAFTLSCVLFALTTIAVFGQNPQSTENKADQTLRSTGRINPSTLGMEFDLPLGSYPGRGINVPISMSYSSKLWRFDFAGNYPNANEPGGCSTYYTAKYAENSASGWTSSLAVPYIEYVGKDNPFIYSGFPHNINAHCGIGPNNDPNYVYRIMVHLPGGETHEMRPTSGASWDNTFYSTDGSNLKYVENSTNNTYRLFMPDGSYYDFATGNTVQMNGSTVRKGTQYSDRNGNSISYNSTGVWTDTLGRTFNAPFGLAAPIEPTTAENPTTYSMPGMTGTYKFQWKNLKGSSAAESALTDWTQDLKYAGGMYQIYQAPWWAYQPSGTTLFQGKVLSTGLFNPIVLSEIELPTGAKYKFTYDLYGRIERIYYPTGGEERFTYSQIEPLAYSEQYNITDQANYGVTHREVYETAGSGTPYEWDYAITENGGGGYKVSTTAPDGTETQRFLHRSDEACVGCEEGAWGYDNALAGMAYEERQFSSTGALLSRKLTHWTKSTVVYDQAYHIDWSPRIDHEESYTYDSSGNGLYSTTKYEYEGDLSDPATPVLSKKTTQWGFQTTSGGGSITPSATPSASPTPVPTPIPSASPVKTTESTYLVNDPNYSSEASYYTAQNMAGLVTVSKTKDSAGTVVSQSIAVYDESGRSPGYRGNPTTLKIWDSTKGLVTNSSAYISTSSKFDSYGNKYESADAKGYITTTTFDSAYHTFPIQITSPVPDPSGVNGSNQALVTTTTFDAATGLPLTTTDANGIEIRIEYDPVTLRPLNTKTYYNNVQVGSTTEIIYNDEPSNLWVKSRTQLDEDNWAESITYFDGLARAWKSEDVKSTGNVFVEKEFDSEGRVKRISNPYRDGESKVWTTNTYDTAGRLWKVTSPDNAVLETTYGVATTGSRIGTVVTTTDHAGKQRRSITNALNLLTRIDEPDYSNQLGSVDVPNQPTFYSYDELNNLTQVTQGVQMRTFQYSSLSRLKQASNPESGTILYSYDLNGNLTQKTDARSVVTSYTYDGLNRLSQRSYTGEPGTQPQTPAVYYNYDNLPHAKGRLTKISSSISATEFTAFDIQGQATASKQTTDGREFPMSYLYNLSGSLIEQTYPSGRTVKNILDADGGLSSVSSKKNPTAGYWNYAENFIYNSAGAVVSLQLGNGKWESTQFNSRLQPTQIALGTTQNSSNLLKLDYSYGTTQNNGNILSQTITVPDTRNENGFTAVQTFTYDSLNRIKSATELIDTDQSWAQTFLYDRYGNRTFDEPNTTTLTKNCGSSPNFTVCAPDRKLENPEIQTSNNRIKGDQDGDSIADYIFDSSGNTKKTADGLTYIYDGENKQIEARNAANQLVGQYYYDGDGKRVKKVVPGTGETTVFVYDAVGKLIAEYSTVLADTPQVAYITSDPLGSPRINTRADGAVIARHDYHPFGEEIDSIASPQRTEGLGYKADEIRKKFTGYERDGETGLDFAQARYFSSGFGRFSSPDPLQASASSVRPQSWNRYAYSYNNPFRYSDPTGMVPADYYDQEGNRIGTDGVNDGQSLLVTNNAEVATITANNARNATTARAGVTSALQLPTLAVRQAIGVTAVAQSNAATSPERGARGGFAETGGVVIQTANNGELAVPAVQGAMGDPRRQGVGAEMNVENPANPALVNQTTNPDAWLTTYHIHPSGEINNGTTTSRFEQRPSNFTETVNGQTVRRGDIPNAGSATASPVTLGYRIVVGAGRANVEGQATGGQRVYFYNGTGVLGSLPLNSFNTINTPVRP